MPEQKEMNIGSLNQEETTVCSRTLCLDISSKETGSLSRLLGCSLPSTGTRATERSSSARGQSDGSEERRNTRTAILRKT